MTNNGGTEMTKPITHADALRCARILTDWSGVALSALDRAADGSAGALDAVRLRTIADLFDALGKQTYPDILRRRADQIDPPAVPAWTVEVGGTWSNAVEADILDALNSPEVRQRIREVVQAGVTR